MSKVFCLFPDVAICTENGAGGSVLPSRSAPVAR